MNNALTTVFFRTLQIIPIILVMIPLFRSYWVKRNIINGLRKTRVALLAILFSILFENLYFIYYGIVALAMNKSNIIPETFFLVVDKMVNLAAYFLLYYLFSHARRHNDC